MKALEANTEEPPDDAPEEQGTIDPVYTEFRVFENSEKNREIGNEKGTEKGKTSKSRTNRSLTTNNVWEAGKKGKKPKKTA